MKNSSVNYGAGRSCFGTILALFGILVSMFFLLNLSFGIFEIPDNLPLVGNLDEAFFTMLLLGCLAYFGIELPFLRRRYPAASRSRTSALPNDSKERKSSKKP